MSKYIHIIYIFIFISYSSTYAQELNFSTLNKEGLLDRQSILCITQDEHGRIIFGGQSQLFYFDSYYIEKLNLDDYDDKAGIYIEHLAVTKDNMLLIASKDKLILYDLFRKKLVKQGNTLWNINLQIIKITRINEHVLLLCKDGLYQLVHSDNKYGFVRKLKLNSPRNITYLNKNRYILTSRNGVYEIAIENENIRYIQNLHLPQLVEPVCTFYDGAKIWIGTKDKGIYQFDLTSRKWNNINQQNSNLLSNNIRKINKDKKGNLYIGTLRGLSVLEADNHQYTNYRHESGNRHTLSQNSIYDIFVDNQDNVWIGTYFGGLNYIHQNPYNITTYNSYNNNSKLNSEVISSVAESEDFIWISTEEEGLAKLDKKTAKISNQSNLTKSNLIKDIYIKDEILYIAQINAGYSIYDIKKNTIQHIDINQTNKDYMNDVNRIFVDKQNNIYLSTIYGLLVSHKDNPTYIRTLDTQQYSSYRDIGTDNTGKIYVLIAGSLYVKKSTDDVLEIVQSTKELDLRSFYIENNVIWLVTSNEILKINSNQTITSIHKFKQLSNAKIIAHNNKLWIARNEGIFCFDLNTKTENIITQPDGLLVKNFENSRMFLDSKDQLFITSLNGLMSFFPDKVTFNKRVPLTNIQSIAGTNEHPILFDRLIKIDNNNYELSLNYYENNFAVFFASNNLSKPLKNKFKYKLDGFETKWNETTIPNAKYANIDPGKYNLSILSSNNDNVWSTTPLKINILVNPPFWLTWWAYLLYGIAALIILHFIINFIVEREILINTEREHQKKINFFTQISHEIRTPLTLIISPLNDILDATKNDHKTTSKVQRVKNNANKLLNIVNELLDFKKIDDGKEVIQPKTVEVKPYLVEMFYLFSDLAVSKQLKFNIEHIEDKVYLELDIRHFDKVIYNLLSNAIKYTPQKGHVFLKAHIENAKFSIEIWDNGIGIDEGNEFKIFEEYYRDSNAQDSLGTGIGLALTKKIVEQHHGTIKYSAEKYNDTKYTRFKVELPYSKNQQDINENAIVYGYQSNYSNTEEKELLLIVEDNIELHEEIQNIFKDKFTILKAYDGQQGLQLANDYLPNIIISDVMMPNMDGIQMCELIKSTEKTAHIPIIMLTANTNEETQLKSLKYGSNVYLYKPFNPNILNLTVTNLLNLTNAKRNKFNIEQKELTLSDVDLKFLNKFEELIENNLLNESFGVEYLSKDLGMSIPILYKKVKAITNLSVNNFVKTYRFRRAISLMKDGHNISEAAYAVGFSDRKYFSKEFKKTYGVSPSEYEENKNV